MTSTRRVFALLGACEDLTERETRALRRGDIEFALTLENRKLRITQALSAARRNAELSAPELAVLTERVHTLELQEKQNLAFLREEMARVRASLDTLKRASQQSRQVRRGYAGRAGATVVRSENVLGRA